MEGLRVRAGCLLSVYTQRDHDMVVIRCEGELDLKVVDALHRAIERACTANLAVLQIDTVGLTFIDSAGVACLLEATRRCEELGARLEIVPSLCVARLLDLTATPIRCRKPKRRTLLRMPRMRREGR